MSRWEFNRDRSLTRLPEDDATSFIAERSFVASEPWWRLWTTLKNGNSVPAAFNSETMQYQLASRVTAR
jgi:hypothetical protein